MSAGRPPLFSTPEELQTKIDEYFLEGLTAKELVVGKGETKKVVKVVMPTISGLALYLGFCDRHSFYEYEKKEKFTHTIKMARAKLEQHYEELLQQGLGAGAIFALKNFGWKDDKIVFNNTVIANSQVDITTAKDEELDNIINSIAIPAR